MRTASEKEEGEEEARTINIMKGGQPAVKRKTTKQFQQHSFLLCRFFSKVRSKIQQKIEIHSFKIRKRLRRMYNSDTFCLTQHLVRIHATFFIK